jgi:hypothetical protein
MPTLSDFIKSGCRREEVAKERLINQAVAKIQSNSAGYRHASLKRKNRRGEPSRLLPAAWVFYGAFVVVPVEVGLLGLTVLVLPFTGVPFPFGPSVGLFGLIGRLGEVGMAGAPG